MAATLTRLSLAALTGLAVLCATPAFAQQPEAPAVPSPPSPWQFEIYGGGLLSSRSRLGLPLEPPAPEVFTTVTGDPSARVPSWYFGYGALLLSAVNTALDVDPGITELERSLHRSALVRTHGWHGGVRLTRALNRRWAVEAAAGYASSGTAVTDAARAGLQDTSESFVAAWQSFLSRTSHTNRVVTSDVRVDPGSTRQLLVTGALRFDFLTRWPMRPYLTAGGGIASTFGQLPRVALTGRYQFLIDGVSPIDETDAVAIRFDLRRHAPVVVAGAGFEHHRSDRWGLRVDVRAHMMTHSMRTMVDASPATLHATGSMTPGVTATDTYLSVQHSNAPGVASSLGPPLSGMLIYRGRGSVAQVGLTTGIFWRF